MKRLAQKLRDGKGMSLTETLVAVLILGLLTMSIAVGIGTAVRLYDDSVTYSEAQTLTSTLSQALEDELRYVWNIQSSGETVNIDGTEYSKPTFEGLNCGSNATVSSENGKITLGGYALISDSAYTSGLQANAAVGYQDGQFKILLTVLNRDGVVLGTTPVISVRALNVA